MRELIVYGFTGDVRSAGPGQLLLDRATGGSVSEWIQSTKEELMFPYAKSWPMNLWLFYKEHHLSPGWEILKNLHDEEDNRYFKFFEENNTA